MTHWVGYTPKHCTTRFRSTASSRQALRAMARMYRLRGIRALLEDPLSLSVTHNLSKYCELYPLDRTFTGRIPATPFPIHSVRSSGTTGFAPMVVARPSKETATCSTALSFFFFLSSSCLQIDVSMVLRLNQIQSVRANTK